jgi:hypothetical protein
VKALAPSCNQCGVLREIAKAGFDYAATKRLCSGVGWQLVADEPELGFVQFFLWLGPSDDDQRLLSVVTGGEKGPLISLPLFYFPEEDGDSEHDRTPFDEAYRRLSGTVGELLGEPTGIGTYEYSHRSGWRYGYRIWRLPEAQVVLLQE